MNKVLLVSVLTFVLLIVSGYLITNNKIREQYQTIIPVPAQIPVSYSAWLPWWEEERFLASVEDSSVNLTVILPVWYRVTPEGEIEEIDSRFKEKIMNFAGEHNINVYPTISNASDDGFDPQRISLIVNSPELKKNVITKLVDTALVKVYGGWDLDWEQVYEKDKEAYTDFVHDLGVELHEVNLKLSVTVHAKSGSPHDWEGTKGQDWESIAKDADEIRIMAYDFHESGSEAGPLTPNKDLRQTLEYAVKIIPKEKIVLGVPTYGYDWDNKRGHAFNYQDMVSHLSQKQVNFSRDSKTQSLYASYKASDSGHTVWFEDAESFIFKKNIAQKYGVFKFSFWHLGGEDTNIWKIN